MSTDMDTAILLPPGDYVVFEGDDGYLHVMSTKTFNDMGYRIPDDENGNSVVNKDGKIIGSFFVHYDATPTTGTPSNKTEEDVRLDITVTGSMVANEIMDKYYDTTFQQHAVDLIRICRGEEVAWEVQQYLDSKTLHESSVHEEIYAEAFKEVLQTVLTEIRKVHD